MLRAHWGPTSSPPCPPCCPCRQAGRAGSAAVCAYSQEALEEVFEGKYKELNKESSRWTVYSGPDMSPRPGSVSAAHPGIRTLLGGAAGPHSGGVCPSQFALCAGTGGQMVVVSQAGWEKEGPFAPDWCWHGAAWWHVSPLSPCLSFPTPALTPLSLQCSMGTSSDKALTFMKDHFLMDGKVSPIQGRPLLVKTDVTYTRIAVDETRGVSGDTYRVMFLATGGFTWGCTQGTWPPLLPFPWPPRTAGDVPSAPAAEGFLHKAVELPGGPHIVESIQLFGTPEPVKNLLLAPGKVGDGDGPTATPRWAWEGGYGGKAQPPTSPSPGRPLRGLLWWRPPSAVGQLQPAPELRRVRAGAGPVLRLARPGGLLPAHPCHRCRGHVSRGGSGLRMGRGMWRGAGC